MRPNPRFRAARALGCWRAQAHRAALDQGVLEQAVWRLTNMKAGVTLHRWRRHVDDVVRVKAVSLRAIGRLHRSASARAWRTWASAAAAARGARLGEAHDATIRMMQAQLHSQRVAHVSQVASLSRSRMHEEELLLHRHALRRRRRALGLALQGWADSVRTADAWRAVCRHLVGENIHRYPMSLTSLECQVSRLVNSDTRPRPTTGDEPGRAVERAQVSGGDGGLLAALRSGAVVRPVRAEDEGPRRHFALPFPVPTGTFHI
jgi:hypothetical protein